MFIALSDLDGFDLAPSEHEGAPPKKKLFVPEFFLGLHWSCQNLLDSFKRLVAATGKETPLHFHRVKADMNCMDLYMVQTYNWFLLVLQKSVLTPEAQ